MNVELYFSTKLVESFLAILVVSLTLTTIFKTWNVFRVFLESILVLLFAYLLIINIHGKMNHKDVDKMSIFFLLIVFVCLIFLIFEEIRERKKEKRSD